MKNISQNNKVGNSATQISPHVWFLIFK